MKTRRRFSAEFKAKVAPATPADDRDGLGADLSAAKDQRAAEPGPDTVGNRAETAWGREANSRPRQIAGT